MDARALRRKLDQFVDSQKTAMFAMLERLVDQDSGSYDTGDVNRLGDYLADQLESMGCAATKHCREGAGYPLTVLAPGTDPAARRVLLIGHRDTVFPAGTAAARPFRIDGDVCRGPGVADMKGGIACGLFAIKAILALREEIGTIPLEIAISSDEEIGSGVSAPILAEKSKHAKAVFSLEPARPGRAVVTSRDGGALFDIEVFGKAAHAGNNFPDGVSAVNALAAITLELAALSDDPAGMNVNVGVVEGGSGAIIVPEHARAKVYTRFSTLGQQADLIGRVREIVQKANAGGIRAIMTDPAGFLPFRKSGDNAKLFSLVREAGEALGLEVQGIDIRGPADSGITASAGVPTICGMGPIGANLHTDEEYMVASSLPEHIKLLALSAIMASERFE
ncbi:MAG: M20 family metallopeptidase [Planctomycetota bacterium]|jgi:glutamate carboxypeptidase|nr:M20 family metallopeptidase [Planctomycetota bacterium]